MAKRASGRTGNDGGAARAARDAPSGATRGLDRRAWSSFGALALAAVAIAACASRTPADEVPRAQAGLEAPCSSGGAPGVSARDVAPSATGAAAAASGSAAAPCEPPRAPLLPASTETTATSKQARTIRVNFPGPDEPYFDCRAHLWVARTVAPGANPVDVAMREVIAGPTPFEEQQGLRSPFRASTSSPAAPPLSAPQVKVTVKDGTAVVDFERAASPYLLQAVCARTAVTSAIEHTLLQFREIQRVKFAIGGEVIEEWDA